MEGEFIVSNWILTCAANRDIIQMWRTHTRSRSAAYGSAAVRFARGSALHVLLLDGHHATNEFSLKSCEAWNWFDVECKSVVSNWMLTCGSLCVCVFSFPFISFSTRWAFFVLVFSFLVRKIPFAGIELTSQRVRRLHGYL